MGLDRTSRRLLFPKLGKFSLVIFALLLIISGFRAYELFGFIFKPNVTKNAVILVPSNADYSAVEDIFTKQEVLSNLKAFRWVAKKKKYKENIKAGRYELKKGMTTNELINKLRIGDQSPVKITFNNVRFIDDFAGKVSAYLELDSLTMLNALQNEELIKKYGFNSETFSAMFIPNTYEFYWTSTADQFIEKMNIEYKKFWTPNKVEKAKKLGLSPIEVSILASIVQEETIKEEEKAKVAGLYINRLNRGMLLQTDPTIKFAINDFTVRRVTNDMLSIDSPYNTYKYSGLPPGPINFPELSSLEAVLNAENHNFLYMCAKEDFSGYHNFAKTLSEHNQYASKYHNVLNKNKIWR